METKKRSERNRTIVLTDEDRTLLNGRIKRLDNVCDVDDIIDTTICQDYFEASKYLPKHFADLIVFDPPYNLSKDFGTIKFKETNDDQYSEYIDTCLKSLMDALKPNGSIYVCCDWKCSNVIYKSLNKLATIKNRITWQREKGRGARKNWKNSMEDIWFAVADKDDYYFDVDSVKVRRRVIAPYRENGKAKDWEETDDGKFRFTYPSNLWDDITIPFWSMPENTDHPTQKPEKLIAKLILASCPKEGIVFDPFVGSGTTSVVAKKLGRKYCGVEIDEDYALVAEKRLEMADTNKEIQGYTNGMFLERNASIRLNK